MNIRLQFKVLLIILIVLIFLSIYGLMRVELDKESLDSIEIIEKDVNDYSIRFEYNGLTIKAKGSKSDYNTIIIDKIYSLKLTIKDDQYYYELED